VLNTLNIKIEVVDSALTAIDTVEVEGEKVPDAKLFSKEEIRNRLRNARIPFIEELSRRVETAL